MRVSVLMTAYNALPYLRQAVDSLLAQTFKDFELVLVDDGSTDGSKEVARAYAAADPRVRYIEQEKNIGRTPALNVALNAARGEYIAVLDADDVTAPDRLAKQIAILDQNPSVSLVASATRFIDEHDQVFDTLEPPTETQELYNMMAHTNPIAHSACMFRRRDALSLGGYPTRFVFAQDFGLILGLARLGKIVMLPDLLVDTREHRGRMTRSSKIAFNRLYEEVELFGMAAELPGLSREARQQGRKALASLHYRLAKLWLEKRNIVRAMYHMMRSVALAPLFYLKYAIGLSRRDLAAN